MKVKEPFSFSLNRSPVRYQPPSVRGAGEGRWRYILEHNLPPQDGRRVLDLGANNVFNALMMLRER